MIYKSSHSEEVTLAVPGAPITILSIVGLLVQIKKFCDQNQIHDLLEKWVQVPVELPQTEDHFPIAITNLSILGAMVRISNFPLQIQNPLKNWVWKQVEWSQSEVTPPAPGAPS